MKKKPDKKKPPNYSGKILLIFFGAILVLYGASLLLLDAFGTHTTGQITVVRRELGDRQDPKANRYSYSVGYEFFLDDGSVVYGNTKTIGSSSAAGIAMGAAPVVYLAELPWINRLKEDISPLAATVFMGSGGFLIWAAFLKKERRKGKKT